MRPSWAVRGVDGGTVAAIVDAPVAVIGGGPAGAAVAITLARRGVPVVVVEQARVAASKPGECLPPTARTALEALGIIDRLVSDESHLRSTGTCACWGSPRAVAQPFVQGRGWHLDRGRFEGLLQETAMRLGAEWRGGLRLAALSRGWDLTFSDGTTMQATYVVDATGRRATVARRLGAERLAYDRLVAIGTVLRCSVDDARVLVEAVPSGWWYSAGLAGDRMVVTYFTDADLADTSLAAWRAALARAHRTRARLSETFDLTERLFVTSASSSRLTRISGDGWLAVGDAAAGHDPLASYGLLAALGGGIYAGHAVADHLAGDELAPSAYVSVQQTAYAGYLRGLVTTYAAETRWRDAPFWMRRALIAS